jgi:hypothetical protein
MNLVLFLVFLFDRSAILISVLFVDRDMIEQIADPWMLLKFEERKRENDWNENLCID